jgi:hypothetical protein
MLRTDPVWKGHVYLLNFLKFCARRGQRNARQYREKYPNRTAPDPHTLILVDRQQARALHGLRWDVGRPRCVRHVQIVQCEACSQYQTSCNTRASAHRTLQQ